jgi:hypothetical protein
MFRGAVGMSLVSRDVQGEGGCVMRGGEQKRDTIQ